jgi:hypothetical protein
MGACPLDPHPSGIWAKLQLFRAFLPWSAPATNVMGWECRHLGPPATRAIIAVEQHHRHTSVGGASGAKVDWAKMAAKIFLAHAREDKAQVRKLYADLAARGLDPWLDEEDLVPGQIWKVEIPKAIRQAGVFLACLSSRSVGKVGYVQNEFRLALSAFGGRPAGTIFLIPVRLDECDVPDLQVPDLGLSLRDIHWVDLWQEDGLDRLVRSIEKALDKPDKAQRPPGPAEKVALPLGVATDQAPDRRPLPSDTVFKEALLKGFNEIFLNPVSQLLGFRASKLLGNYRVGAPVPYNTNIYHHRYKLVNVPLDTTLYPVKATFRLTQESRVEEKLVTFLCYADSFGEWTCKWISDESIG